MCKFFFESCQAGFEMFTTLSACKDLLLKDLHLPLKLLLSKGILLLFLFKRIQTLIQSFQFFFQTLVFCLGAVIGFLSFVKFSLRIRQFLLQFFQILSALLVLQKEKIDIQCLKFFPLDKIDPCCLGLFLQWTKLFGQLTQNICHTDKILAFFFQLLDRGIFSSFEFYDSRCLVKKFPAVLWLAA